MGERLYRWFLSAYRAHILAAIARQDGEVQHRIAAELSGLLQAPSWLGSSGSYVLPSGSLHFVPWGILDLAQPVVIIPTAGWLLHRSPIQTSHPAAVVGDPEFGGKLPPLRAARREAIAIAKYFAVEPLLGPDATEARLREQIGRGVSVLHLATHGLFNATRPLQSAIVLSNGAQAAALTAERLFEAPRSAHLVVLSACETGVGEAVAGDDFLGLPRSLYLGGASTVLSSLWPVEDRATAEFMGIFHQEALREGDYGKAWLKARDELRARGLPPWIYGAFVLGGGEARTDPLGHRSIGTTGSRSSASLQVGSVPETSYPSLWESLAPASLTSGASSL